MRRWLLLLLACPLWAGAAGGIDGNRGDCLSGNCKNGSGTVRFLDGDEITGDWVDKHTVAGHYEFRRACWPDKALPVTLDGDGNFVEGEVVRCGAGALGMLSSGSRPTFYKGSWATDYNPFTKQSINTYKTGTYTDAAGVEWQGEFSYIPVRESYKDVQVGKTAITKGAFIFIGTRVDAQLDEQTRGLFISESTIPNAEIRFLRARPDYLQQLRETFVADRALEAAEREADARASRELFGNIVKFLGVAANAYVDQKAAANADRATMESLNRVMTGQKTPAAAKADLLAESQRAADAERAGTERRAQAARAEVRNGQPPPTVASATRPANPLGSAKAAPKADQVELARLDRTTPGPDATDAPATKVAAEKKKITIEWGPVKLEAIAVCRQSSKSGKWVCNGALDDQIIVDEPTLESALARQHCKGGTLTAGGPLIDGVQWDAYRCGHSLGVGDYDMVKRYGLIAARRSYMCRKYEPLDGRCDIIYSGQDKSAGAQ